MADEKKQIIEELVKEVEEINNIAIIRFILNTVKSFKIADFSIPSFDFLFV